MTSNPVLWYSMRASGIVAYGLLSLGVYIGMTLSNRERLRWPRFAVEDVHRFLGLLTGVFIWIHIAFVALDSSVPFSIPDLAVPFHSAFRPFWTAMGVVAAELLLALAVTNKLRRRLPHGMWRNLHRLNLVVWVAAAAHGIGSGTDRTSASLIAFYLFTIGAVAIAAMTRVVLRPAKSQLS